MRFIGLISVIFILANSFAQSLDFLEGTWQGIIKNYGQTNEEGNAIWFRFDIDESTGIVKGECRSEMPFTEYFAYKNTRGKVNTPYSLNFDDYLIGKQQNKPGNYWCMNRGTLVYNDSTGYLSGKWEAIDCKRRVGEMTLYRSKYELSTTDTNVLYHSWFNNLCNDLKRGWNAHYVRDIEMRDFDFIPVLFDHDKDMLQEEFKPYLEKMVNIVQSHSDLRIKIIGHTDSNGSDRYNIDLSKRRANNIKEYITLLGLKADRVVIEYRGENDPAANNATFHGKKLNRRVDFEFI